MWQILTGAALALGIMTTLQGCAPAVATGAAVGVAVVHDRRSTGTVLDDNTIEFKLLGAMAKDPELSEQTHINATAYNGIVLLSGEAPSETLRARALTLARGHEKVRNVYNEVAIAAPSSLLSRSSDTLITSKVKTKMIADENLDPTRAKVVTERGTVYLMGMVTRREAELATGIARSVGGVQKVVKLFEYLD